jgi:hypothetical protein
MSDDISANRARFDAGLDGLARDAIRSGVERPEIISWITSYLLARAIGIHGLDGARAMVGDIPEIFDDCEETLRQSLEAMGPL